MDAWTSKPTHIQRALEQRVRRLARRFDLRLEKSRSRTLSDPRFGGFMLVEPYRNYVVLGANRSAYDATLPEICAHLKDLADQEVADQIAVKRHIEDYYPVGSAGKRPTKAEIGAALAELGRDSNRLSHAEWVATQAGALLDAVTGDGATVVMSAALEGSR